MTIKERYEGPNPCFEITGIERTKRNEKLVLEFCLGYFGWKMYSKATLRNWKNKALVIRYAGKSEEMRYLIEGIINERSLPRNHTEKSLLTEEEVPW